MDFCLPGKWEVRLLAGSGVEGVFMLSGRWKVFEIDTM